jgi:uncharacterized protein DUF5674
MRFQKNSNKLGDAGGSQIQWLSDDAKTLLFTDVEYNLYLQQSEDEWIEYDSMINLRPSQGNRSRGVDDPAIRQKIREIVNLLVEQS